MMIECELCHEWYHGKCLKIARGKVKEDDKYTCPICDWRVKIPRDAARPKLEDLIQWQEEIQLLPFQPEEEEVLKKIIDNAQDFRSHIAGHCNPVLATASEAETQRFYLRKIEGAEILLAYETNFFRQELHKWSPVAPEPPPVLEVSKSTRKPRPTKLQKLLQQYHVDDPDDLPEHVKGKANSLKRKALNAEIAAAAAAANSTSPGGLTTSPGAHGYGQPMHGYYSRPSSAQPQTPGLSIGSNSHAHQAHGPDSASSHGPAGHDRSNSTSTMKGGVGMELDSGSMHPPYFMQDGHLGGPQFAADNSTHTLEEHLLHGIPDLEDLGLNILNEDHKTKALEILSRTDVGRKKAEEIFGRDVWGLNPMSGPRDDDPIGIGVDGHEGDDSVNRMFIDLVNDVDDDEDDAQGGGHKGHNRHFMTDSLESERNGIHLLLDDD
jgi:histone demethylase JARID1